MFMKMKSCMLVLMFVCCGILLAGCETMKGRYACTGQNTTERRMYGCVDGKCHAQNMVTSADCWVKEHIW